MKFQIFQYRLPMDGQPEELNAFLAGQRVVAVHHHVVPAAGSGLLVFVVETTGTGETPQRGNERRVDYKEVLSAGDFAIFSRLRELRKTVAEREGVPVYAVFSNAQLAEMARRRVSSAQELGTIDGIGAGRVEKHAEAFLGIIAAAGAERKEEG